jgi:hypothetical protein
MNNIKHVKQIFKLHNAKNNLRTSEPHVRENFSSALYTKMRYAVPLLTSLSEVAVA